MKGLVWRDNGDVHSWRVCENKITFCTNDVVEVTPDLVLYIAFPLKCLWLLLLLRDKHYTVAVLVFDVMICYKLSHISR